MNAKAYYLSNVKPLLLLFITFLLSCSQVCPEIDYAPQPYQLIMVDSTTGLDLFNGGSYAIQDLSIQRLNGGSSDYYVWEGDSFHVIQIPELLESGEIHDRISIGDSIQFTFYVRGTLVRESRCFSHVEDREIRIEGVSYSSYEGYYRTFKVMIAQ